jgi:hypothetical protein
VGDDVDWVAEGRGELEPVGVGDVDGLGLPDECLVELWCFLLECDAVGELFGFTCSGELVASRALTSLALSTGTDAGVTALPTIWTATHPLTMATATKTAHRPATRPR